MRRRDSALAERGSMLPLFLGLVAASIVLALGIAELGSSFVFRETMQQVADQVALKGAMDKVQSGDLLASELAKLDSRFSLNRFQLVDGKTVEVRVCGNWQGWFRLPGLDLKSVVCVNSASR